VNLWKAGNMQKPILKKLRALLWITTK